MLKQLNSESDCLKIVTVASLFIVIFALTAGILTHSTALLLDGSLALLDVAISIVTLWVAKLLRGSTVNNKSYPYGYFKIEPLAVSIEAALIIGACFFSILHAGKDLLHNTVGIKNYAWGFSYTLFTILISVLSYIYIQTVNVKEKSPLLEIQAINWKYGLFLYKSGRS